MTVWHFDVDSTFGRSDEEDVFFRELNSDSALSSSDLTNNGFSIESYDKIIYLDLNGIQEADAPFTLKIDISDLSDDIGTNPKPVNYFSFGYHVRGRSCTALTVGRLPNSDRFCLGTITDTGVLKSTSFPNYPEPLEVIRNNMYRLTLVVDNTLDDENKIQLYAQTLTSGGDTGIPYVVASSEQLSLRNFSFVDRKLILGSSAWTNEPEWEGLFDLAHMKVFNSFTFLPNTASPPIFYTGSPYIPQHHSVTNATSVERNNFRQATVGDAVQVKFHTLYRVYPERVRVYVDDTNFVYKSSDPSFMHNGLETTLYTFETTVTSTFPSAAIFGYNVDITNFYVENITFTSPMTMVDDQSTYMIYTSPSLVLVRNAPLNFEYEIASVGMDTVAFRLLSVTDEFTNNVTGYVQMMGYTFTFKASLNLEAGETESVHEVTSTNMTVGDTVTIFALLEERFYNITASVTNLNGQVLANISPKPGKFGSPIETIQDEIPPTIQIDATTPPVSAVMDSSKNPGIRVQAYAYDNTANERRGFSFYVNVFDRELTGMTTEQQLYDAIKTNYVSEGTIHDNTLTTYTNVLLDAHFYTDVNGDHQPIQVEKRYYVYMMAEDFADNRRTTETHYSLVINNTLSFESAEFDNTFKTIGTTGDNMVIKWSSQYVVQPDIYNVYVNGDGSLVPESPNNYDWTLTLPVTAYTAPGLVTFSVSQSRDIEDTAGTSFTHVTTSQQNYVENRLPTFMNGTAIPQLSALTFVSNSIDDFTIRSNASPFSVQLDLYKLPDVNTVIDTFSQDYTSYSDFTAQNITFANLEEGDAYKVTYNLTNVFTQRANAVLKSSISTSTDSPIISAVVNETNVGGEVLVTMNSASYVKDPTTEFNFYSVVLRQGEVNMANVQNVISTLTPLNNAPLAPGVEHKIDDLLPSVTHFRNSEGQQELIVPSEYLYTLYLIADDGNEINLVGIGLDIYFLENVNTSIQISKSSNEVGAAGHFVKDGEAVTLTWMTPYKSKIEDFTVSMMGVAVTAEITDSGIGMSWKAESVFDKTTQAVDFTGGAYNFVIQYLGNSFTTSPTSSLFVDLEAPTFAAEVVQRTGDSIHVRISDIQDDYTSTTYNFQAYATVEKVDDSAVTAQSIVVENSTYFISNTTFVIGNLTENTFYNVTATMTDPAGNTRTVSVINTETIRTRETFEPTITMDAGAFKHADGETPVSVSGIVAVDQHSDFDVYVGIFQLVESDPDISVEFMQSMNGSGAVLKFSSTANTSYTVDTSISKFVPHIEGGSWALSARPIAYNTTKRGVVLVVDNDDNLVIRKTTFQVNSAPVPDWLPPTTEVDDESGLLASTDASVSFMETPDGQIVGFDSSGSGNFFTVNLASGVGASEALSQNSVVNPVSLNMAVIESVVVPTSVEIAERFSYGMWINVQNDTVDEPFSLLNAGDSQVVVVEGNQITVSSGLTQVFTTTLPTNDWVNIMVSSTGSDFKLYINTKEILAKKTTTVAPVTSVGSSLNIGTIPNLLIDDIRIYNEELSTEEVAVSVQSGSKQVHLTFEAGDLPEYTITFDGDTMMLNGSLPDENAILFYNSRYTLYQNDNTNNNKPVHFVNSGGEPIETPDIEYFIDNVSVGNDSTTYVNGFQSGMFRKIVITPTSLGNVKIYFGVFGSTTYSAFFNISTNSPYIINNANISATNPISNTNPTYTTNTPVGKLAVNFESSQSQSISLGGETFQNMNMNSMTIGTWVNVSDTSSNMPIMSRKDAFDMGIDDQGFMYINIESDNIKSLIGKIQQVEFTSTGIVRITNLTLSPPASTRYYYVFASTEHIYDKAGIIAQVTKYGSDSLIVYSTSTSSTLTLDLLDVNYAIDAKGESVPTKSLISAYLYVVALQKDMSYTFGDENDYKEIHVKRTDIQTSANFVKTTPPAVGSLFTVVDELTVSSSKEVSSLLIFPLKPSETPPITYRHTVTTVYDNGNVYNISGLGNRPTINLNAGDKLIFNVDLFIHPIIITDLSGSAVAGVVNNDIFKGVLEWTPSAPGTYKYGCSSHSHATPMGNTIVVTDKLTATSVSSATVGAFANGLITNGNLSEGYNKIDSAKNNLYYSTSALTADKLHKLTNLQFASAFELLNRSSSVDIAAGNNLMFCFVAVTSAGYQVTTSFLNFVDFDNSMLLQMTDRGFSNRYYEFSPDKHILRLRHYDNRLATYYSVQIDYLFDFSEIGTIYEYEYTPTWSSTDQYHALMFYDLKDSVVSYNTQHAHGFWAKGNMNKAMFENTEGWPTWHDGTTGNTSTSSKSAWPRYQRLTVIQAKSTAWTGQVNNKTLNPANTYSEANELFFEFFSDPERKSRVASGTASQLRSYDHNDYYFHRSNKLYMTILYYQNDPNPGGLEFGNLVRLR